MQDNVRRSLSLRKYPLTSSPSRMNSFLATVRRTLALASYIAVPLGAAAQAHPSAPALKPDTVLHGEGARVAAVVRSVFAAGERGDLAALDTLYAGDSLTVVEGAGINRGWADYRDHHLGPELKEMKNFRYRPFEIEARVAGEIAWAMFRYALQADINGRAIDNIGRGTAILEKRAGRWIVRHTQTTSRPRRPTDPPMPR